MWKTLLRDSTETHHKVARRLLHRVPPSRHSRSAIDAADAVCRRDRRRHHYSLAVARKMMSDPRHQPFARFADAAFERQFNLYQLASLGGPVIRAGLLRAAQTPDLSIAAQGHERWGTQTSGTSALSSVADVIVPMASHASTSFKTTGELIIAPRTLPLLAHLVGCSTDGIRPFRKSKTDGRIAPTNRLPESGSAS